MTILYSCAGGDITLPAANLLLADRADGGNLLVNPPRPVWERGLLTRDELLAWSCLIAAAATAMLAELPQLDGGCINYWEAGNWALNPGADPPGPKRAPDARVVHMHLIGRGRFAVSEHLVWGEAPRFPSFEDRFAWAAGHRRLTAAECVAVVRRARQVLEDKYAMAVPEVHICPECAYPAVDDHVCAEEAAR